uniref:hypothetical protein n=1 Tax=Methylobacterium sp. Leaf118 TaxID=2876562 RepID=UPI001E57274B
MLHEPSHHFTGTPADASGSPGFAVEACLIRVEAGSADLYLDRPGRAGSRRRLARLHPGDIAVPLGADSLGLRLLVFPGPEARLSSLEPAAFRTALDAAETGAIAAAERWIERTVRACGTPLEGHPGFLGEGAGPIDSGFVLRPAEGLVWVSVTEGALTTALPGSGPAQAGDLPVPVVAATGGIISEHGAQIVGRGSARLAQDGGLARAFADYQARLARSLAAGVAAADATEAAFVAGKPARDRAVLAA